MCKKISSRFFFQLISSQFEVSMMYPHLFTLWRPQTSIYLLQTLTRNHRGH